MRHQRLRHELISLYTDKVTNIEMHRRTAQEPLMSTEVDRPPTSTTQHESLHYTSLSPDWARPSKDSRASHDDDG